MTVFDWSAEVLDDWIHNGLPRYGRPLTDLFPTRPSGLVSEPQLFRRLGGYLDELGFPPGLDLHSFRRAYATHLLTVYGFDLKFVQMQMGHQYAATTSIYTLPAADFQASELSRVHAETGANIPRPPRPPRLPPASAWRANARQSRKRTP